MVLYVDIETMYNVASVWRIGSQYVPQTSVLEHAHLLCTGLRMDDGESYITRDLRTAWEALDRADTVVTFNGNRFDLPILRAEFVSAGYDPPAPFRSIDLYSEIRRLFQFQPNNTLRSAALALGLRPKEDSPGVDIWTRCGKDDPAAWAIMEHYCRRDVDLLAEVHDRIGAWIGVRQVRHMDGCPRCGSHDAQKRGFAQTRQTRYQQYKCNACGGYYRGTIAVDRVQVVTL